MTGEMYSIDQEGNDSNGESWPLHAAIAKALGGELKPFDVYQGPYIVIGEDVRVGNPPYAIAPVGLGVVRLWIIQREDYFFEVYREDTDETSLPFYELDDSMAIEAAKSLL